MKRCLPVRIVVLFLLLCSIGLWLTGGETRATGANQRSSRSLGWVAGNVFDRAPRVDADLPWATLFDYRRPVWLFTPNVAAARMATLTVTNGNDSGAGSLRQAIADTAANDTITFQAGVITVTLTSATLDINKVLTIDGGTSGVTITRGVGSHVFRIFLVTADLTLNKLTVTNGDSSPGTSSAVSGGAIRVTGGALTLTACTFSGNSSSSSGGAIEMATTAGALTVSDCTFTNNTCGNAGGAMNISSTGPNSISTSTFSLNTSGTAGALNIGAAITVTNCTFTGNSSAGTGGAINVSATSTFTNVTIVGNTTSQASANVAGGVRTGTSTFTYTFNNCLIAGNTTPIAQMAAPRCSFPIPPQV